MYPRWTHWRDLKGICPICGEPAHVERAKGQAGIFGFKTSMTCTNTITVMAFTVFDIATAACNPN